MVTIHVAPIVGCIDCRVVVMWGIFCVGWLIRWHTPLSISWTRTRTLCLEMPAPCLDPAATTSLEFSFEVMETSLHEVKEGQGVHAWVQDMTAWPSLFQPLLPALGHWHSIMSELWKHPDARWDYKRTSTTICKYRFDDKMVCVCVCSGEDGKRRWKENGHEWPSHSWLTVQSQYSCPLFHQSLFVWIQPCSFCVCVCRVLYKCLLERWVWPIHTSFAASNQTAKRWSLQTRFPYESFTFSHRY